MSALPAPSPDVAIEKVDVFPLVYPTTERFKFFEGPKGRPDGLAALLVRITASDGTEGWGQSVPGPRWSYETLETVYSTATHYLAPELIGLSPFDNDGIDALLARVIVPSFTTGQPVCRAAFDLALFDLTGKLLRHTARQRWRRRGRDTVRLSWTLNPRTLDEVEGLIALAHSRGYQDFNVRVAPDAKFDLELCTLIRRLAPDAFLWPDANGGYDEATALELLPKLAGIGVPVIEQPLPANNLAGYRRLKEQKALPILMDDGIVSSTELRAFLELGMLDGVVIKPARCGGLAEARRQIELLLENGLMFFGGGLTDPDCALAGSLLLFGAYELEHAAALNGPQFIDASILRHPFHVIDATLAVPSGYGLGVEVDLAKVAVLSVTV